MSDNDSLRELLNQLRDSTPATVKLFVNVSMEIQEAILDRLNESKMSIEELLVKANVSRDDLDFLAPDDDEEGGCIIALGHVQNPRIEVLVKLSYALDINLFRVAANEYDNRKHKLQSKNKQ